MIILLAMVIVMVMVMVIVKLVIVIARRPMRKAHPTPGNSSIVTLIMINSSESNN